MKLIGIGRLGRDMETRYTPDGTPVGSISVAWNYGKKDSDGKRPTQWAELAMFGDRVEKLAPYLVKGQQIFAVVGDARVEVFEKRDGTQGFKLVGRIESIDFAGGNMNSTGSQNSGSSANSQGQGFENNPPRDRSAPKPKPSPNFDDLGDDIPF
jgi:single-strand DNA-binding protein